MAEIKSIAPMTKRYCLGCKDITDFKYNPIIGHSGCNICGARFALNPNNYIVRHFIEIVDEKDKKILELQNKNKNKNIESNISCLKGQIKARDKIIKQLKEEIKGCQEKVIGKQ